MFEHEQNTWIFKFQTRVVLTDIIWPLKRNEREHCLPTRTLVS